MSPVLSSRLLIRTVPPAIQLLPSAQDRSRFSRYSPKSYPQVLTGNSSYRPSRYGLEKTREPGMKRVVIEELTPGMILAKPVTNNTGLVVLPLGAELDEDPSPTPAPWPHVCLCRGRCRRHQWKNPCRIGSRAGPSLSSRDRRSDSMPDSRSDSSAAPGRHMAWPTIRRRLRPYEVFARVRSPATH